MAIFETFVLALGFLCLVIFMHELGHVIFFRRSLKRSVYVYIKTKPFRIQTGVAGDYVGMKPEDYVGLASMGILVGFIPFIFIKNPYIGIPIFLFYILGIRKDVFIIVRNKRLMDESSDIL